MQLPQILAESIDFERLARPIKLLMTATSARSGQDRCFVTVKLHPMRCSPQPTLFQAVEIEETIIATAAIPPIRPLSRW